MRNWIRWFRTRNVVVLARFVLAFGIKEYKAILGAARMHTDQRNESEERWSGLRGTEEVKWYEIRKALWLTEDYGCTSVYRADHGINVCQSDIDRKVWRRR